MILRCQNPGPGREVTPEGSWVKIEDHVTISPSVNGNGDLTGVYFIYNLLAINILCIFIYNYLCFIIDLYNII